MNKPMIVFGIGLGMLSITLGTLAKRAQQLSYADVEDGFNRVIEIQDKLTPLIKLPTEIPTEPVKIVPSIVAKNQPITKPTSISSTTLTTDWNNLIYPSSSVIQNTASRLELASKSDSSIITQWYKDKLIAINGRNRVFTTTTVNGVANHKLKATVGSETYSVNISGKANEITKIEVIKSD